MNPLRGGTAFSRSSPVHRTYVEGRQRVDSGFGPADGQGNKRKIRNANDNERSPAAPAARAKSHQ
jgi:hypothetical protein